MPLLDHQHLDRLSARPPLPRRPEAVRSSSLAAAMNGAAADGTTLLLRRARFLRESDRLLLEMVFQNQLSLRQISRLMHVPAGTISRRLQRLCARLREPIVLWLMDPVACKLPLEHRQLAIEHFVQGLSARQLGELHLMRPQRVRLMLEQARGWYRAMTSG